MSVTTKPLILRVLQLSRAQRLLLYGAAMLWFVAFVHSSQRDYQDNWILDGVFGPFVAFIVVFLFVLAPEDDNRVTALLSASTMFVVTLVAALKYQQPYGVAIDAVVHYLMVENLVTTGEIIPNHTYAAMPGAHAWLASYALFGGLDAATAVRFGVPLFGAIGPLLVYWLCRSVNMPEQVAKYTIVISCLVIGAGIAPNGTNFSKLPLLLLLGAVLLRSYYVHATKQRLAYTLIFLIVLPQLLFWHFSTPLVLPFIIVSVSLARPISSILRRRIGLWPDRNVLWAAVAAGVFFLGRWTIHGDWLSLTVTEQFRDMFVTQEQQTTAVPQRLFQITFVDALRVTMMIHGRDAMMLGLMLIGIAVIWRLRSRWEHLLPFYAGMLLVCVPFVTILATTGGGALGYRRWTLIPIAISGFFAGPALWWIRLTALPFIMRGSRRATGAWLVVIIVIITVWTVQVFSYQPLVPKVHAGTPDSEAEYVVWLHGVNTAYQERMLHFAQTRTNPDQPFAIDVRGGGQYQRYFGVDAARMRGLYYYLFWNEPVDPRKVDFLLLHWPGIPGGLGESLDNRSHARIEKLIDTPGWGLVYDNGESFILSVE